MTRRRNSIKRWSWLALFGFAWVQLGLVAHLSLVSHDIDAQGHSIHSHPASTHSSALQVRQKNRNYQDDPGSSVPVPKTPNSSEDCQVLHFIEHSNALLFASTSLLQTQLIVASSSVEALSSRMHFVRHLYRLAPAQSPPQHACS